MKIIILILVGIMLTYFCFLYKQMDIKDLIMGGIVMIVLLQLYIAEKINEIKNK
jgi:hypothetical protein